MQDQASSDSIAKLDQRYEDNVRPYESILKTISMHNSELYALHQKYHQLRQQYNALTNAVHPTPLDEERKKERQRELRKERNRFIEEAITAREQEFNDQYKSSRLLRLEEISLKYQQISFLRKQRNNFNVFLNLQQGLLEEVMHQLGESGEESLRKEIAVWLNSYNAAMNNNKTK